VSTSTVRSRLARFGGAFRERRVHESAAAVAAYRALRRGAARVGLDVVAKTFYSPIPDLRRLPPGAFDRVSELPGIAWDLDAQLAFLRAEIAPAMAAFVPPDGYDPDSAYNAADAAVLYGMVRALRPARIVELGSGQSTLVMARAARENAGAGRPAVVESFDPYPGVAQPPLEGLARLERIPAQEVPLSTFAALGAGDVLFVDTTHTVKLASDVNFVVLEVLPRLADGVVVHLHDIFLPYEYPRTWLEDFGLYWTEQYLVQAFLALNGGYEVLAAVHALQRQRTEAMRALLPAVVGERVGGAFWLRRTGGTGGGERLP
jgi:predicted O-methyltransferase YrrM